MPTTLEEFRRRVFLNIGESDGRTNLAFEQAINDAHQAIARAKDFDELMVLDTANAKTVANQHRYHLTSNLALTRPKDVYSIRYMANSESRKLHYITPREMDLMLPYPEGIGTRKPTSYTQKGMYLELNPIPDANANLYVYHSKWPSTLSNDTDQTEYLYIDDVLIQLTTEMTLAYIEGGVRTNWTQRAFALLSSAKVEHMYRPDVELVARPFCSRNSRPITGNYWEDPFVKRNP